MNKQRYSNCNVLHNGASLVAPGNGKEYACNVGDPGLIPELGRCPGEGAGYPFPYSCLEKPHGQRRLVGYTVHGVTKSQM